MDWLTLCLERCRKTGVILDTNVLVAWWVAAVLGAEKLGTIRRIAEWESKDIERLGNLLSFAPNIVITPGVLAEACNLLEKENRNHNTALFRFMATLLGLWKEEHVLARVLAEGPVFATLGAADATVYDLAAKGYLAVTSDAELTARIANDGFCVININHMRSAEWLMN